MLMANKVVPRINKQISQGEFRDLCLTLRGIEALRIFPTFGGHLPVHIYIPLRRVWHISLLLSHHS